MENDPDGMGKTGGKAGRTSRSWIMSILVAVVLSALITWSLGKLFHPSMEGHAGMSSGCGTGCCDPEKPSPGNKK